MRLRFQLGILAASVVGCFLVAWSVLAGGQPASSASALALQAANVPAVSPPGAARVVSLAGQVSLERESELWAVQPGEMIPAGAEIVTGPEGHALFEVEDGSRFEVFPNSHVVFRANRGNWRDLLDVFLGKVKVQIQKFGGRPNPYRVNSPTALIAVRGTLFEVTVEANETTVISVVEGVVAVSHRKMPGNEVLLHGGQTLRVIASEALSASHTSKLQVATRILETALDRAVAIARSGGTDAPRAPNAPGKGKAPPPGNGGRGGDNGDKDSPGGSGGSSGGSGSPPGGGGPP